MRGIKYLTFFCLIALVLISSVKYSDSTSVKAAEQETQELPKIGSYENFKKILKETENLGVTAYGVFMDAAIPASKGLVSQAAEADSATSSSKSIDHSGTNVQVEGVDEADTVKTDGEYIYKISNNQLIVAKANPVEEMKVVETLNYDSQNFNPVEMYVDDKSLVVIGNNYNYYNTDYRETTAEEDIKGKSMILPPNNFENSVKVLIYNLSDKANLQQIREVEIDGSYISSRKIGDNIYLVNNKNIPVYRILEEQEELPLPAYRDSADGGQIKRIGYEDICYFPGSTEPNYLLIAGINLESEAENKLEIKTYLGSGQSIYASLENLYVAVAEYKQEDVSTPVSDDSANSRIMPSILPRTLEVNTSIYKFALHSGTSEYIGKGSVAGRILNQFSMDEHKGNFRIATTIDKFKNNENQMSNNVSILDNGMNVIGSIENIAPGEKIYSVRFLGDRGYMVTFKTVDPLFVLDLKDPRNPQVLGELKIPGYSNYLHPYDENHIIGFGKEAIEVEEPHWSGEGTIKNAYYLGMKVALFDVSDVQNPIEKFKLEIGDRGTESELLWNHKALLFDKEKNLIAFPVTVHEIDYNNIDQHDYLARKNPQLAYGRPVFQGAFVYNLSLTDGFKLKGTITHHPAGKFADLQRYQESSYERDISRILYIGENLYTISNSYLKANNLDTLAEKGGIQLLN
ncbi:MAG: hypothetical protein APF84_04790 [Gracilibacter sp. BRH_c7a]|nr:MAG: hypothetical protein APF84_04790 [Gracilibacter sp. BRH_c7a]